MRFIADLHVHSRYSRATSREMGPEGLWRWSQLKGIRVVGTGDFTHPKYFRELQDKLQPAEKGLFRLKKSFQADISEDIPVSCRSDVSFMLQAEVSSIYSKGGRTRKVHSILLAPGFREAGAINYRLSKIGNLASDGRPILGLDAARLLELVLDASPEAMVVPAHAWTPHFSVFGAASGFDSLAECYGDLAKHIHAIETGLSSDPPMNRRLSALDGIRLISNSDAHSPSKLGREANIFDADVSYAGVAGGIRTGAGLAGTVEFFPEEGKYHLDGHRACGVRLSPEETRRRGFLCPVCGRRLTVGVMHRVEDLADRKTPAESSYVSLIPLVELLSEAIGKGEGTKAVQESYQGLLDRLGSEFRILMDAPLKDIEGAGGELLGQAISRAISLMRKGEVSVEPGYDGVYGKVRVFSAGGMKTSPRQARNSSASRKKGQERLF